MAARTHRAAGLTLAAFAAATTFAVPNAAAATACAPGTALESCGGATSNGSSYNGVVAVPGLSGTPGGSAGGGGGGGCAGCEWTFVPACLPNGPANGADAMCASAALACENRGGGILMRIYRRENGGPWEHLGTTCVGGASPVVTVEDVRAMAGAAYRAQMHPPAATIGSEPATYSLVNVPTYFAANGAGPMTQTFGPDAIRMTITATPTWAWAFGDGATLETSSPGGPYPTGDVTHTYRTRGARTVTLTTRWSAQFTVVTALGSFGPFDVGGPQIAPSSSRAMQVYEGRAELVDND
jgi:hypothetical protein